MSTDTTNDHATLLMIKGVIADLPEAAQQQVKDTAAHLRSTITLAEQRLSGTGMLALALVGAEAQLDQVQG